MGKVDSREGILENCTDSGGGMLVNIINQSEIETL